MRIQRVKAGKTWKVIVDGEVVAKGLSEAAALAKVEDMVHGRHG